MKPFVTLIVRYKKRIVILTFLEFLSSGFILIGPYLSRAYVDNVFLHKNGSLFLKLNIIGAVILFFSLSMTFLLDFTRKVMAAKTKFSLSVRFVKSLYAQDIAFLQAETVGKNLYRISDGEATTFILTELIPRMVANVVRMCIILLIAFVVNPGLTLVFLAAAPVMILQGVYVRRKIRPLFHDLWKRNVELFRRIEEDFSHLVIIKALALEHHRIRLYVKVLAESIRASFFGGRRVIYNTLSSTFFAKAVYGVISLYGGWLIVRGEISLGSFTAVMLYLGLLVSVMQAVGGDFDFLAQEGVSLEKFSEALSNVPQIKDAVMARKIVNFEGAVQFKDVRFGYQKNAAVFEHFSMVIPPRAWVGLVGPSGSGKTTVINLLLRLFDPWEGQILVDGLDSRQIRLASLRRHIAVAAQEPLLFNCSLRENILCGLVDVSDEALEHCLRITQLYDFIKRLPQGENTNIGEDGFTLSQGFKQRVALARAVIREPGLLILDEATASIDAQTEERILVALCSHRRGRSTIIISHRLTTVRSAAQILFLDSNGKLETSSHDVLFASSGAYRNFFQNQMGG